MTQARIASLGVVKIYGPAWSDYAREFKSNMDANREFDAKNQEVVDAAKTALEAAQDAINDKLPDGFICKIEAY